MFARLKSISFSLIQTSTQYEEDKEGEWIEQIEFEVSFKITF